MKRRMSALLVGVALLALVVPAAVLSLESTVTCTVSAVLVSATVSDGSVNYGALELGTTKNTAEYATTWNYYGMVTPQTQAIHNTGNVPEVFRVKTSNALGTTQNWTLGAVPSSGTFTHAWNWGAEPYVPVGPISFAHWTAPDSYVVADESVPPDGFRYLELEIDMPTSTTDYGAHNVTVTVQAMQA